MNYWTFDGVRLDSFGAVTLLDDYLDMPTRRGDNIQIPMRDGKVWTRKFFDQRALMFGITVHADTIPNLETKLDAMKALFGVRSLKLLSNIWLGSPGIRNAYAEIPGNMSVSRDDDPLVVKCVITFMLPDPFFRGSVLVTNTQTINATPFTYVFNNPGSAEERCCKIRLVGPLSLTTVTNTKNSVSFYYNGAITGGHWVLVDCYDFSVVDDLGNNVVGNIIHTGDVVPMALVSGNNPMWVSDSVHTTGQIIITSYPPYL